MCEAEKDSQVRFDKFIAELKVLCVKYSVELDPWEQYGDLRVIVRDLGTYHNATQPFPIGDFVNALCKR